MRRPETERAVEAGGGLDVAGIRKAGGGPEKPGMTKAGGFGLKQGVDQAGQARGKGMAMKLQAQQQLCRNRLCVVLGR